MSDGAVKDEVSKRKSLEKIAAISPVEVQSSSQLESEKYTNTQRLT